MILRRLFAKKSRIASYIIIFSAKKVGQVDHKLIFGLLNKHRIASWEKEQKEYLSFAFVCSGNVV